MKIQHNMLAIICERNININVGELSANIEKLSSGYRINQATDDAAGLSISEKMRRMIRGLTQASTNCQDGISMVQTADGALHEVHDMLQRMNVLAVQSANGTNTKEEREALQQEFAQIQKEIDRVSETTTFNGMRLFGEGSGNAGGTGGITTYTITLGGCTISSSTAADQTALDAMVSYDARTGVLIIKDSADITLSGSVTGGVKLDSGVTAKVTFNNVNIDVSGTTGACAFDVNGGNLELTLEGVNTLKSGYRQPGLQVNTGSSLTITENSTGSLTSIGDAGAGIGGGHAGDGGTITINGGTVEAIGGYTGAGIGGGYGGDGGTITINGGTVEAVGGYTGAGIGGGYDGDGGTITINGGTVNATGEGSGAGIGGGNIGVGGTITINGGTVNANGGRFGAGAGIGGGIGGDGGDVTINGGNVTAKGGTSAPVSIGAGYGAAGGTFSTGTNGSATIRVGDGTNNSDSYIQSQISGTDATLTGVDATINGAVKGTPSTPSSGSGSGSGSSGADRNTWWIQAGADAGVGLTIDIGVMNTGVLGIEKGAVNILTEQASRNAIEAVSGAIEKLSTQRSGLGAYQNRLEHTMRNLDNVVENTTYAESRIRDTDMAQEMVAYSNNNIILQSAQAMLAQANKWPENVLRLLQ